MNNVTNYHADCTIYTNPSRPEAPEEAVLCLDFKHLTYGKGKSLSQIGLQAHQATDNWRAIAGRLVDELPKIDGVNCSVSRQSVNNDYAIELVLQPHQIIEATLAITDKLASHSITVNPFTGSLP